LGHRSNSNPVRLGHFGFPFPGGFARK
jgi:hypothetical protein